MKTIMTILTSLSLSLTLAGQAMALQNTAPVRGLNTALQMKIEQDLVKTLGREPGRRDRQFSEPATKERNIDMIPEIYAFPGCLCHVRTRAF